MSHHTPAWINDRKHDLDIARFVLEGDECVDQIVSGARHKLHRVTDHAHRGFASALSAGSAGAQAAVEALYLHLAEAYHLTYEFERAFNDFSGEQQIRLPGDTVLKGEGTCIDLTILFLSCLARAKLWPICVVVHGHALAATWTEAPDGQRETSLGLDELRNHLGSGKIVAAECTGFVEGFPGHTHKLSHADACRSGRERVCGLAPEEFCLALDVRRAWESGVQPLPSAQGPPSHHLTGRSPWRCQQGHWPVCTGAGQPQSWRRVSTDPLFTSVLNRGGVVVHDPS